MRAGRPGACRGAGCWSAAASPRAPSDGDSARPSSPPRREAEGRGERRALRATPGPARCTRSSPAHQRKRLPQRATQRRGVGVGGRDEAVRLDPGELQHPPAGVHRAPRLLAVEADELAGRRCACSVRRPKPPRRRQTCWKPCWAIESPGVTALAQPLHHLGRALADRVQIAGRDHQQRHAVDAVVVQPVADHRAALEGGRLDSVQRDGDRAAGLPRAGLHAARSPRTPTSGGAASARR